MRVRATAEQELGLAQVELRGHVTPRSASAVRRVLTAAATAGLSHVIIDVCELDDVDAHLGLALLECNDDLRRRGGWLCLVHGAGRPGTSLRQLGVHDRVPSSPSRAAAGWVGR